MATVIELPALGEDITRGSIASWNVEEGSACTAGQALGEVELHKVVVEIATPIEGTVLRLLVEPGQEVASGAPLAVVGNPGEDVDAALRSHDSGSPPVVDPGTPEQDPEFEARPATKILQNQLRRTAGRRLAEQINSAPHAFAAMYIYMEKALEYRQAYNNRIRGTKISVNDMIIKACALALREHPLLNASYQEDGIVLHGDIHIGAAVGMERGLLVPVLRYCDQRSLENISKKMRELGRRAKRKQLSHAELSGSTFSVSNLGMFPVHHFLSIVNPPESGILSAAATMDAVEPGENGEFVIRKRMEVTIGFDHRVLDGVDSVRFLMTVKELLENPERLEPEAVTG